MSADIATLSLTEMADAIRDGEVSSRQATESCIGRLEAAQPKLNCLIALEAERAMEAAADADADLARGHLRGPLHGVPLAHKDLFYRSGRVATCGSAIRRDFVPDHTATVLERLDAAGAIDLGTLHMAEFAMGPSGHNVPFGDCRNPWDTRCIPGGSSSGVGAATAARLIYGGLGSDTAGSIRLPAACCGLVGLKPTQTRISRHGVMPLSFSLDNAGPLTRTARDCARLTTVIAGADPRDPTCSLEPVPDYEDGIDGGVENLRIGIPSNYFFDDVDEEVRAALDRTIEVFQTLGASTLPVRVPDLDHVNNLTNILLNSEAATVHGPWMRDRPEDYSPEIRGRLEPGYFIPATRYLEALRLRGVLTEEFIGTGFAGADVLFTPLLPFPVPQLDATRFSAAGGLPAFLAAMTRCTRAVNYLGLPALSVPCGFSAGGTPFSFQLIGRPFAEGSLLRAAHAYQQATDWHRRIPMVH
jgi:aspartyl-tRNA(Asn)/glutamyl-tRNA(Gln) amidotransferase subunit A